MWCDQAKWVWSRNFFFFGIFHLCIIQALFWWKPHRDWAIGSPEIAFLVIARTIKKTKKLSSLFGYIFKLKFVSSDWFCLIASHICKFLHPICGFVYCIKYPVFFFIQCQTLKSAQSQQVVQPWVQICKNLTWLQLALLC